MNGSWVRRLMAGCLLILCFLCSCMKAKEGEPLTGEQGFDISSASPLCETDSGVYFFREGKDHFQYLHYLDHVSGKAVPVCGKADCMHNTDSCNAWFGPIVCEYSLYWSGQKLYVWAAPGSHSALYEMNADGSDRRKVAECTWGTPNEAISRDGYGYVKVTCNGENDMRQEIWKVSLAGGKWEKLYETVVEDDWKFFFVRLLGWTEEGLLICQDAYGLEDGPLSTVLCISEKGEVRELLQAEAGHQILAPSVHKGMLYYTELIPSSAGENVRISHVRDLSNENDRVTDTVGGSTVCTAEAYYQSYYGVVTAYDYNDQRIGVWEDPFDDSTGCWILKDHICFMEEGESMRFAFYPKIGVDSVLQDGQVFTVTAGEE